MSNDADKIQYTAIKNHVSIPAGHNRCPIEITVIGKFPAGCSQAFFDVAFEQQRLHEEYIEEFNEPSALIGKPSFPDGLSSIADVGVDPTAVYTFGVDVRDLVFHRHEGHRVIIGITGSKGCILRFSVCTPKEAEVSPMSFFKKMYVVKLQGDRMFSLRFNGSIYHQFSPVDYSEKAFFAVSVHSNEAAGLTGHLLEEVLAGNGSIPLLTEPAPNSVLNLQQEQEAYNFATFIDVDCIDHADKADYLSASS